MSKNIPIWATIFMLLGLCILCALGTWQLKRLKWKAGIIEKLNTAYAGEASQLLDLANIEEQDFSYGRVGGIFMPDKAILLGPRTRNGNIGHDLIVPLKHPDGALLVNLGWTNRDINDLPIYHLKDQQVWFEGLARWPDWNYFTPENKPEENLWYRADTAEMTTAQNLKNPFPFLFYAENSSHKFDATFPNNARWYPNNNHLQYTLFWFSMAGILIMIYVLRFIIKSPK